MASVLFVEDDPYVGLMVAEGLQDRGYDVVTVHSPSAAFRALEEPRSFMALVTDVDLGPGTDGFGVARCARAIQPDIAVVFISGAAGSRYTAEGVRPSAFVAKPCLPDQVADALDAALK